MKWIWLCLTLVVYSVAQDQTFEIGVQELKNDGIKQNEANIISERFRNQFGKKPEYKVLERSNMTAIMEEQGFQESGACDGEKCSIELGKILGVEFLAMGQVGQIGSMYVLSVKLVNVETSEVVASASQDYTGPIEGVLTDLVPKLVEVVYQKHVHGKDLIINPVKLDQIPSGETQPQLSQDPVADLKKGYNLQHQDKGALVPYVFYTLGAAALGWGVYEHTQVNSKYQDYSELTNGEDFEEAWNKVEDAKTKRNVCYSLGAALLATGIVVHFAF